MRISGALIVLLLMASCRATSPVPDERTIIAYAKAIDVATLDPLLPSQPLEEWLRLGPARVDRTDWRISCDLKFDYDEPPDGYPLCVKVVYWRGDVSGWAIVTVGTIRKGFVEPPRFEYAAVRPSQTGRINALSDLPATMDLAAQTGRP